MSPEIKNDLLYLLNILESVEKIFIYTAGISSAVSLYEANDQQIFNATLTLFTQIGENVAKISQELKNKYTIIDWQSVKDFRNKVTHDYESIDIYVVFDIISDELEVLKTSIRIILSNEISNHVFDVDELLAAKKSKYYKHLDFNF